MGLFRRPALTPVTSLLTSARRLVIAEAIDNPTNLGAIIRSAAGLGWEGIILSSGSADPLARRALRVSMGTGLMLPFARLDENDDIQSLLREHGFRSFALTPSATGIDLRSISVTSTDHIAIFLGSERDGLDAATLSQADEMLRIPMYSNVDSLNVGAAAAIALFELGPSSSLTDYEDVQPHSQRN
jgi:tRNA G18 (ribose-2'-O)-methylase SpoU